MRNVKRLRSAAAAGFLILVGGASVIPVLANPAPAAERPATPGEKRELLNRTRALIFGVQMFMRDNDSHLPANLGETASNHDKTAGKCFVTPDDEKKLTDVPAQPTAAWVNEHTSFVYLGGADITSKAMGVAKVPAYALPILHEKLDGREGHEIAVGYMDGHSVMLPFDEAKKAIEQATKDFEKIRKS